MKRKAIFMITLLLFMAGAAIAQNNGSGWPSAAQLTQYGVGGLSQPAGTTGAGWRLQPTMYSYPAIAIWCSGSASANTAAKNYFRSWSVIHDRSQGNNSNIGYEKDGARVYYTYDGKEIMIISGIFASGNWPANSVWSRFGLAGLSLPPNAIVESVDEDTDTLFVVFISGGITAYTNLRNQITAKGFQLSESEGNDTDREQNQIFYNERLNTAVYLNRDGNKLGLDVRVF